MTTNGQLTLPGINQIGTYQSDLNRPTIVQKIKNYFSGGRLDRTRAIFMRSIGRPLHLSYSEVEWRIHHGRPLTGYTTNSWRLNDFLHKDPTLQKYYQDDQYSLDLSRCNLDTISLANAEVGDGSIKNSKIEGLDVSHSKLGGICRKGEGFNVSGAKGDIKLGFSDLSGWKFSKRTEISNKAEINEACVKFLKNDITPILGIMTSIDSISNHRDNIPHKAKLMNHLASAFYAPDRKISDATPQQLGVRIFLENILLSPPYHEAKRHIDCKSKLNDKDFDAILDLYKYGESQENRDLRTHIRNLAYASTFYKFVERSPQYLNTLVSNVSTVEGMNDLAINIRLMIHRKWSFQKIQQLDSPQKDTLRFLKLKCGYFKEEAKKAGNGYIVQNLERLEKSIPLDIEPKDVLRFLKSHYGYSE